MNTKLSKLSKLALAMGALVMAGGAMAQSSATGSATSNAKVIRPITITPGVTLEFGNIVAGAGTVLVAASSATTRTDSTATLTPGTQTGTIRAAVFAVGGEGAATYAITLPADGVVILGNGAATPAATDKITLSAFTKSAVSGTLGTLGSTAGTAGTQSFFVGATLTGVTSQTPGTYTGTYSVTVAYN